MDSKLYYDIRETQLPIIYRPEYNVHFLGLEKLHPFDAGKWEKLHPFDAGKWGRIFQFLKNAGIVSDRTVTIPNLATKGDLLVVHTKKYLKSLKCSLRVAYIAEVPPICIVPNYFVQLGYLQPMRYQTGGSILAGKLALERGWAINIGGGFHHCSSDKGGGFCAYADITLLIKFLFNNFPQKVKNVIILDLDAHQVRFPS
ncbi:Histone deacetylase domain [Popillia japonica]|uniref:Histone deacetylase domain n=1 Tax=Popillia japonica TaxID=7064 RepID=A0AAW1N6I2_POPJA